MRPIFNTPSNATIALAACTWLLTGCGESASSCRQTRTCEEPSDQGDGGSGATDSGDGDETEKSPTSGDGDHETTGDGDETADDDDEPEPCDEGTWDHDEDPDTACQDWTTCAPGEFVSDEGTPTGDRECLPCDDGFSEEDNAEECRPWTDCPSGVLVAGTATSDTECASRAVDVAVGDGFSCILREEGTVACWGKNDVGQLGRGDTDDSGLPQPVMVDSQDGLEPLTGVVQLSAGEAFACALRESGNVWCWGNNSFGQASLDASDAGGTLVFARPVESVDEAVKIASATDHSCAILADSTVTCWGHRSVLVSGMDVIEYENVDDEVVRVAYNTPGSEDVLLSGVVDLGVGFQHTCVALENGDAVCWGFDSTGAVGSDVYPYNFTPPLVLEVPTRVQAVSAAYGRTCWLDSANKILCRGHDDYYVTDDLVPVILAEDISPASFDARKTGICVVATNGTVWSSETDDLTDLVQVEGLEDIVKVDANFDHTCAVQDTGRVYCWGKNESGELGDNTIFQSSAPVIVPGVDHALALTSGRDHTCARLDNGKVKCWGKNDLGQLGLGSNAPMSPPMQLGLSDVIQISSYGSLTYAVKEDHTLRVWGTNMDGTISVNTVENVSEPTDVVSVATGGSHACAIRTNGELVCWGSNQYGALGTTERVGSDAYVGPTVVEGVDNSTAIDAGLGHTCVVRHGEVACWGENTWGQITLDSIDAGELYVVPELEGVVDVALPTSATMALTENGSVVMWGQATAGLQGDGTAEWNRAPSLVPGISKAVHLAAGDNHACVILDEGSTLCWGANDQAQTGGGTPGESVLEPQVVEQLASSVQIAAGLHHTCALHKNGTVSCWGSNEFYQLGHDRVASSPIPLEVIWQ